MRYLRIAAALTVLAAVFICTFLHIPIGTLCALCPMGFAEVATAGGSVPWALLPGVLAVLAIVFLLGRVFCSWVCPTSLLRNIFGGRRPRGLTGRTGACPECGPAEAPARSGDAPEGRAAACSGSGYADSAEGADPNRFRLCNSMAAQGIVLAALLILSLAVHFPVFCLFCPIGLVFGSMFAVSRLFVTWQPGWGLVVFPALLVLELFVLRRWCSAICSLGFFFGLMAKLRSRLGFLPRVRVDRGTCIHGEGCKACAIVYPEDICAAISDPCALEDCILCLDCKEHCPTCSVSVGKKG